MTKRRRQVKTADTAKHVANPDVKWLIAILCVHLLLAAVYWHYTPFGAPPDEGPHGLYVQTLVEEHKLPVFDVSDRQRYESHQPPLYYLMGVPFYLIGQVVRMGEPAVAVRLLSMLLGALSILVIYRAVLLAFPRERHVALASAGFAALLPTHVMLSSSVGNDILAEVIFGLAVLVMVRIILDGPSWRTTVALGAVLGLGLLTKTTCVLLFPAAVLAYGLVWRRGTSGLTSATRHIGVLVCVSVAVGGWWLVRNQALYGDVLAMSQFRRAFEHTARPEYWLNRGFSGVEYWLLVGLWTFHSFWGVFGHMNVFMPSWAYIGLAATSLCVIVACLRVEIELRAESAQTRDILLIYNVVLLLVLLAFLQFNASYFQTQGRYLYPALVPISAFWVLGVRRLLPARMRSWMPYAAASVPLIAQVVALATCIVPKMPFYL